MSRKSCGSEGSEWQAETPSSPRHAPTLELCPSSSLPLSSVHQLQDLAELPGARWRFYRLRVDRPERGHRVQREWGGSATWGNSSSNPSCCAPRKRGFLETAAPQTPRRVHELTADGAAESSLLFVGFPSSGKGQTEEFGWTRRGSHFREAPRVGFISQTAPGTWIWARSVQIKKHSAAVSGCGRRCSQPASEMLGKGLNVVGERDSHRVLGDSPDGTLVQ